MIYYTTFLYFFFYLAEELYPPIRRGDEAFLHDPHIGAVNSVSCSPFSRYVKNSESYKQYDYSHIFSFLGVVFYLFLYIRSRVYEQLRIRNNCKKKYSQYSSLRSSYYSSTIQTTPISAVRTNVSQLLNTLILIGIFCLFRF